MVSNKIIKNIEGLVSTLNVIRESKKGVELTCQEVSELIKGLPGMKNRPGILIKHHILIKTDRSHYKFCEEPIYFANLKSALDEAADIAKASRDKYNHKPKAPKNPKTLEEFISANNINDDDIARYLVSTGNYQVSKKIVTWKEL